MANTREKLLAKVARAVNMYKFYGLQVVDTTMLLGHAKPPVRWALVRDADVAERMVTFIKMNSIGISKDSQVRAACILQVISDEAAIGCFSLPQFSSEFCKLTIEHAELILQLHG